MLQNKSARVVTNGDGAQPWYALYTRHQHEKMIAAMLCGKGFEVFLPLCSAIHRWKDRKKAIQLPVFPCYVFLRGGLDRLFHIVSTPGVYHLVCAGGRPASIPQAEIDAIHQVMETRLPFEPYTFMKAGNWVRVTSGPLAGIEGVVVRQKSLCRLVLSVELLQKSVAVEIGAEDVERIATQRPLVNSSSASQAGSSLGLA